MRTALIATAVLLCSCASPTLKEYEDRVERGRARLAAIAKAQFEKNPSDEQLLLTYAALAGEEAGAAIEQFDPDVGPLGAVVICKAVLFGAPGRPFANPTQEEAAEVLETLEEAMPESSLVPLYRLRWLKLSTAGERNFWEECRTLLQEAVDRDQWVSPIRKFFVRWIDWLNAHESDDFVKASIDLRLGDGHVITLIWLSRLVDAVLLSPAPPDALILDVARLLHQVNDRIMQTSPDTLQFMIASVVSKVILPARFLGLWRSGDVVGAETIVRALDRAIECERSWSAYSREYLARYEAKNFVFKAGLSRMLGNLLAGMKDRKSDSNQESREAVRDLVQASQDADLQLEGCRRLDAGAREYVKALREEMSDSEPLLERIMRHAPDAEKESNALHWVLRDAGILSGKPFPRELLKEAFDREIEPGMDYLGLQHYQWLLKEALLIEDSIPISDLKSVKTKNFSESLDLRMVLRIRREPVEADRFEDGINQVKEYATSQAMKGYCQLLALRAKEDRGAAAAMLPAYDPKQVQEGWAMIGETLRHVTGQDFGYDLDAWRKWLLAEPKN